MCKSDIQNLELAFWRVFRAGCDERLAGRQAGLGMKNGVTGNLGHPVVSSPNCQSAALR